MLFVNWYTGPAAARVGGWWWQRQPAWPSPEATFKRHVDDNEWIAGPGICRACLALAIVELMVVSTDGPRNKHLRGISLNKVSEASDRWTMNETIHLVMWFALASLVWQRHRQSCFACSFLALLVLRCRPSEWGAIQGYTRGQYNKRRGLIASFPVAGAHKNLWYTRRLEK